MPMFIAMDRPKHTGQRRTVAPAFTPSEMVRMSDDIRRRTAEILDGLEWGKEFDWVDQVSIELTTQMLAILFDFPWEDRRKLTFWSDWAGDIELVKSEALRAERLQHMYECGAYFTQLWNQKVNKEPTPDLISMMIHSDAMSQMDQMEFLGNLILLIVGGNDTTRNSMSAAVYGLDLFPQQRARLEADPALIPNTVQEIIRWQTPLAHMRRTATEDAEVEGQMIRAGEKVALWYISANRDESVFGPDADQIVVDRPNARRHLAFAASARGWRNCRSPSCWRKWRNGGCASTYWASRPASPPVSFTAIANCRSKSADIDDSADLATASRIRPARRRVTFADARSNGRCNQTRGIDHEQSTRASFHRRYRHRGGRVVRVSGQLVGRNPGGKIPLSADRRGMAQETVARRVPGVAP
jgi:hypothetical protein